MENKEDCNQDVLTYGENLFSRAAQEFTNERFRVADIYSVCAYSAAAFVKGMSDAGEQIHEKAKGLIRQSWRLSKQARSKLFLEFVETKMNGVEVEYRQDDDEVDLIREDVDSLVKWIRQNRTSQTE